MLRKIFVNNINHKFKSIPFNIHKNHVGESKYFPAAFKEWKNEVYFFNSNSMKNLPVYNINIDKIIRSYFYSYFFNRFIRKQYVKSKSKHLSLNKIYVSRPELRHTNDKVIITIYTYNKEISFILDAISKLEKTLPRFLKKYLSLKKKIGRFINWKVKKIFYSLINNRDDIINIKEIINIKNSIRVNLRFKLYKSLKYKLYESILVLRKYKLYFHLNKSKFDDIFLYDLGLLITKFFNKKIVFNIINLHSIAYHADLLTEFLRLKLRRRKPAQVLKSMRFILNRVNLPQENLMKGKLIKSVDFNLLENRYKNIHIASLINNSNLYGKLSESYKDIILKKALLYYNNIVVNNKKSLLRKLRILTIISSRKNLLKNKIFNSIKYKNLRGIRLEVKGRLTRRYRADRAVYKVLWKGGLKNIDSSFKGLSVVNFRGYADSNVEYSIRDSKRRIGSFAVKGWIAGGK